MHTSRRQFITTSALAAAGSTVAFGQEKKAAESIVIPADKLKFSLKVGMCRFGGNDLVEKFKTIQKLGYDGIELNSPGGLNKQACRDASIATGLPIHGVVNSLHWRVHFSSPSAEQRAKAVEGLKQCIRDAKLVGGSAVLIVPAVVNKKVTEKEAWERSIACIQEVLPMAAANGIHILIENVWNRFLYDHEGANNQTADKLKNYIDEVNSPWVGSYFDIGNHQKYGKPADWIRTLGRRIVKLDVKDWGEKNGFCKIGEGDVDWSDVRKSLLDINYTGWATAEVRGGNAEYCGQVLSRMKAQMLG